MKNQFKKYMSLMLILTMLCTVFTVFSVQASAAGTGTGYTSADDVEYVTSGKYIANWGAREEDCVFLSKYAQEFYTGSYVFDDMSKSEGGTGTGDAYKSELYSELKALMTSKHSYTNSYKENNNLLKYTDCVMNDTAHISSFYSGKTLSGTWDSAKTWNKEHTWPNSKGLGGSDEDDVMMIRPTAVSENSSRGNTAYGKSSGYYNPNGESGGSHDLRGDVARITLYIYTRWGNTSKMWGSSGVIESLDVLLEWMEADPVDTWEMGRNDSVQSITGTRNVFVDYPEYAWLLFGQDVPDDLVSPSGNKGASGNGGSSGDNGSAGDTSTPSAPDIIADTFEEGVVYKGMITTPSDGTFYMRGEPTDATKPWYIDITANRDDGIDIYVEKVDGKDGAYRLYFMDGSQKKYIRAYERTDKAGSGTIEMTTTMPSEFYTYSSDFGTFIVTNGENSFYLGTRTNNGSLYVNVSCSNTSYITGSNAANVGVTQFVLKLVHSYVEDEDVTTLPGENETETETETVTENVGSEVTTEAPDNGTTETEVDGTEAPTEEETAGELLPELTGDALGCKSLAAGGIAIIALVTIAGCAVVKKKEN